MVRRWISDVPSGMRSVRAMRKPSSSISSLERPMPPWIWMARSQMRWHVSTE